MGVFGCTGWVCTVGCRGEGGRGEGLVAVARSPGEEESLSPSTLGGGSGRRPTEPPLSLSFTTSLRSVVQSFVRFGRTVFF